MKLRILSVQKLVWFGVAVLLVWVAVPGIIWWILDGWSWSERGQFGDMFGTVNALFAGLAFAGLLWALMLQREELKLQRKELKLQREELIETRQEIKGQKEQLTIQAQTLQRQNFEDTFFQLLRFHNNIVDSIVYEGNRIGRNALAAMHNDFKNTYKESTYGRDHRDISVRFGYNSLHLIVAS